MQPNSLALLVVTAPSRATTPAEGDEVATLAGQYCHCLCTPRPLHAISKRCITPAMHKMAPIRLCTPEPLHVTSKRCITPAMHMSACQRSRRIPRVIKLPKQVRKTNYCQNTVVNELKSHGHGYRSWPTPEFDTTESENVQPIS